MKSKVKTIDEVCGVSTGSFRRFLEEKLDEMARNEERRQRRKITVTIKNIGARKPMIRDNPLD